MEPQKTSSVEPTKDAVVAAPAVEVEKKRKTLISPLAEELIGIGSAVAGGLVSAYTYMSSKVWTNFTSKGALDDLKNKRRVEFCEQIKMPVGDGVMNALEAGVLAAEQIHKDNITGWSELGKYGVKPTNMYKFLRKHQKVETVMLGAAVAGLALGPVLEITRNVFNRKEEDEPKTATAAPMQKIVQTVPSDSWAKEQEQRKQVAENTPKQLSV